MARRKKSVQLESTQVGNEVSTVEAAPTVDEPPKFNKPRFRVTLQCPPPLGAVTGVFEAENETLAQQAAFKAWYCDSSESPCVVTRE